MKKQIRISKLGLGVLATICALAVATTASAKNPKEVKMTIVDNKLVITTPKDENDCQAEEPAEKGCIKVKKTKK